MRKIAVLTEARSDYGVYVPVLKAIQESDLELNLLVTGMHLLKEHGYTADEITFKHTNVKPELLDAFIRLYSSHGNDWLLVLGDRKLMRDAANIAFELDIPVAHIQGGDVTSGACKDEVYRRQIERVSSIHFTSQKSSADRLIGWGEEPWRVKVVGPLGIFNMQDELYPDIRRRLGLSDKPIVLIVQHPVKNDLAYAWQILFTVAAVNVIKNIEPVLIYPNSDEGSDEMIIALEDKFQGKKFKNLSYLTFQSLLKESSVLVGNSSIALHEAPFYGVPCVEIGDREIGREHWGRPLIVDYDAHFIRGAIQEHLESGKFPPLEYKVIDGPGIIVKTLLETPIDEKLLRKGYK